VRIRAIVLIAAVIVMAAALMYSQRRTQPLKVSGFIEADEIRVGSRVGGRVAKVLAVEGQKVKAGNVLVELEPFDLAERRAEAAARLDKLKNGPRPQEIAAAEARLRLAQAQRELAATTLKRVQGSFQRNAASPDELDNALQNDKAAVATVDVRAQELDQLKVGTRKEEIAEAQAALSALDRQLAELTVKAPVDGVVEAVDLQPGDLVAANAPVLSLMDSSHLWVRAYVPENRMNLQPGQEVAVSVDSLPDKRFKGRIGFVSRQAEFTPNNVQTPEERSKQVFRIKVDLEEGLDVLRAGMSADVWLGGDDKVKG
jgi:multidrug resistance efflux pump